MGPDQKKTALPARRSWRESSPAFVDCTLVDAVERGDHSLFIGEVVNAGVSEEPAGRADEATLWLRDLGERVFYGG